MGTRRIASRQRALAIARRIAHRDRELLARLAEKRRNEEPAMTDAPTLHAFLDARYTERETAANAVLRRFAEYRERFPGIAIGSTHDPHAVLTDTTMKRAILELHEGTHECSEADGSITWVFDRPCHTAQLLGTEFVSHSDYREEWRP